MREELPPGIRERAIALGRRIAAGEDDRVSETDLGTLLEPHGFAPRIREDDDGASLVCYPTEWEEDGEIHIDAIGEIDRAIELPLTGPSRRDWKEIATRNRRVVERVEETHGTTHAANVASFAVFMNNHRARPIAQATEKDVTEFLQDYYPRNVWPSEGEAAVVKRSVTIARRVADEQL